MMENKDPRERLVVLSNEIVDVAYKLALDKPKFKVILDAKDDQEKMTELMKEEGAFDLLLRQLTNSGRYDTLMGEYIAIRQTIEAMETTPSFPIGGEL